MALSWKLVIDSTNAPAIADFWAEALNYEVEDPSALNVRLLAAGHIDEEAVLEHHGHKIFRGYAAIRHPDDPYRVPSEDELDERVDEVCTVLYLLFNEAHLSTRAGAPYQRDLAADAAWLAALLCVWCLGSLRHLGCSRSCGCTLPAATRGTHCSPIGCACDQLMRWTASCSAGCELPTTPQGNDSRVLACELRHRSGQRSTRTARSRRLSHSRSPGDCRRPEGDLPAPALGLGRPSSRPA